MQRLNMICTMLMLAATAGAADGIEPVGQPATERQESAEQGQVSKDSPGGEDVKTLSGMSILGNDEAPKSLVIVPWKGSQIGDMPGISRLLDDSTQPVDKEVFLRELTYYQIKSQ